MLVPGGGTGTRPTVGMIAVARRTAVGVAAGAAVRVAAGTAVVMAARSAVGMLAVSLAVSVPHAALLPVLAGALAVGTGVRTAARAVIVIAVSTRTVVSGVV